MAEKLSFKGNTTKKTLEILKNTSLVIGILLVFIFLLSLPNITSIDFMNLRNSVSSYWGNQEDKQSFSSRKTTIIPKTASETKALMELQKERANYVNDSRARLLVESATNEYYKGYYEEALRKIERALIYDPCNFSAFKLSGQIFFENNKYRKAFNSLERANQIPNDDKTLARDLDVLRKILRYNRNEIDKLRHTVYVNPNDYLARARLKELEEQVQE